MGGVVTRKKKPCTAHHWLCGQTVDGVTEGVCKVCGAKRTFVNSYDYRDGSMFTLEPKGSDLLRPSYK